MIDGRCLSACTLVRGVIPRERICVTRRARLGFLFRETRFVAGYLLQRLLPGDEPAGDEVPVAPCP